LPACSHLIVPPAVADGADAAGLMSERERGECQSAREIMAEYRNGRTFKATHDTGVYKRRPGD